MAVFQIDIEKTMVLSTGITYYWTNVYHVVAADQAAAVSIANSVVVIEKSVHSTAQTFTKCRVRQNLPLAMSGSIIVLTGTGARANPADVMPPFNCVRVDFGKAIGRPCRKYLRINVGETEQANGLLAPGTITAINSGYRDPLVALGTICDPDGDLIINGVVLQPVQMRQLRRGSKRKIAPVI